VRLWNPAVLTGQPEPSATIKVEWDTKVATGRAGYRRTEK
jgi:hypothetical protein